ncbi:hypothetical protein WJX73_010185 [Symbiochloris irregularis]|uniref:Protein transport protein Sec61 subunit beta n=1 Tax=Symbiochloris irregularis TaxID=706552 RepID=A0AAW1P7T1_9CHLO
MAAGNKTPGTVGAGGGSGTSSARAPPTAAGMRKRTARGGGGTPGMRQNIMNFYTDDSAGLRLSPVIVVVMSVSFIAFVTLLHIVGKIQGG